MPLVAAADAVTGVPGAADSGAALPDPGLPNPGLPDPARLPLLVVGGLHRSGTTALARALAASPGVRALADTGVPRDEGQHLQRVLPTAAAHGGPGTFAFDPGAHLTESSALASPATADALLRAWWPFWRLAGGEHLGWGGGLVLLEKSPPDLLRTRLLQCLFPEARFVIVLRHPAVVSASTTLWRPELGTATLLRHWVHAHAVLAGDAPFLRHCHVVRYEDLVARPGPALAALGHTLDIDPVPGPGTLAAGYDERHLAAWPAQRSTVPVEDLRALEEQVRAYGYRLEPPYVTTPTCPLLRDYGVHATDLSPRRHRRVRTGGS